MFPVASLAKALLPCISLGRTTALALLLSFTAFHASAALRVEFTMVGTPDPKSTEKVKDAMEAIPGHIRSRASTSLLVFWGEFEESATLTRTDVEAILQRHGLDLGCYYQGTAPSPAQSEYAAFTACRNTHVSSLKTTSANTCATATTLCDGSPLAVAPWGLGSTILPSPDGFRNPMYDPFFSLAPWTNTWGNNYGCLQSGELNTTWLRVTITSNGWFEWSFQFPEFDGLNYIYMDWIVWQMTASTCANISANNAASAPLRCNWNNFPESPTAATGMVRNASSIPIANEQDNFESSVSTTTGSQFLIILDNWSGGTFNSTFDFSLSGQSAGVCTAVLSEGSTELLTELTDQGVLLGWVNIGDQPYTQFAIERAHDQGQWQQVATLSRAQFMDSPQWTDAQPLEGPLQYRLRKTAADGSIHYSNVATATVPYAHGFAIGPVPGSGRTLNVQALDPITAVSVTDMSGRNLMRHTASGQETSISVPTNLSPGMYLVEVTMQGGKRIARTYLVQ